MAERLTLPPKGPGSFDWWQDNLQWATDVRTDLKEGRRKRLRAYTDKLQASKDYAVRVNIEAEKTDQKRHQLYFRSPILRLQPHPRTQRGADAAALKRSVAIFREVLQRMSGKKGLDMKALMDQLLVDVLCPAGIAFCKVGYERFEDGAVPIQIGMQPGEPMPGSILGLQEPPMVPVYGEAPNVIAEHYYVSRISPGHALVPPYFTGTNFARDCDYLGHDFYIARHEAKRRNWKIPDDIKGCTIDDDDLLTELSKHGSREDQLKCREIYCYAQRVGYDTPHPDKIARLVFVDGMKVPVISEYCRDQVFDQRGRLTQGLKTLPIKALTLRYVSDTWCPPSDCELTEKLANELSEGRTMMITHRRKAVPMRWININKVVDERIRAQVQQGEYYDTMPVDGNGQEFMGEIARAQYPRENFSFNDYIMADVDRLWALGANQQGVQTQSARTATEQVLMQRATDNRMSGEQEAAMGFHLDLIETVSQLVQLYADHEDYVEIVGEDGAKEIAAWDKTTIRGEFLFDVVPDSAARPDAAHTRDLSLNRYNLVRNDPNINGVELLKDTLEEWGASDPERFIKPPEPAQPERPRISLALKGEDLIPSGPQYQNVVNLLQAAGIPAELSTPTPTDSPDDEPVTPAPVVDRERLRMAVSDESDQRAGGLAMAGMR